MMKQLLAASAAFFMLSANAAMEPVSIPSSQIQHTPHAVKVCNDEEGVDCAIAAMPREVGRVERIIRGNFVSPALAKTSWLALTNQHASLCYLSIKTGANTCAPVLAEIPQHVDIDFRENGKTMPTMSFTIRPEATLPVTETWRTIRTFMGALSVATSKVRERAANPPADRPRDGDPIDVINPAGGGNGGFSDGAAGGSYSWFNGNLGNSFYDATWNFVDLAPVMIDGAPAFEDWGSGGSDGWGFPGAEAITSPENLYNDFFPDLDFVFDEPVQVEAPPPPPAAGDAPGGPIYPPDGVTVMNTTTCVFSPIGVHCVAPRPPPLGFDDYGISPLPAPSPVGWTLCGTFNMFCSRGNAGTRGTYEEMAKVCNDIYEREMDECQAYSYAADLRSYRSCRAEAGERNAACLTTAREVSRKGQNGVAR